MSEQREIYAANLPKATASPPPERSGRFSVIPARAFDDRRIPRPALLVLGTLGTYGDRDGWCWPSQTTLGNRIGLSRSLVNRYLALLSKLGYLDITRRQGRDGGETTCLYRILFDGSLDSNEDRQEMAGDLLDIPPVQPERTPPVQPERTPTSQINVPGGPGTPDHFMPGPMVLNTIVEKLTCPLAPKKSGARHPKLQPYSAEYNHFWAVYPRHEDKVGGWKAWQARLEQGDDQAVIFRAVENYARYLRARGTATEYVKLPATFIGPRRPYLDWVHGSPRGPAGPPEPKGFAGIRAFHERQRGGHDGADRGGEAGNNFRGGIPAGQPF